MKYLVTGGTGFVGSHLVEKLLSEHHSVIVVDNLSNGNNHIDGVTYYHTDVVGLMSPHKPYKYEDIDGIFHLATAPRSASLTDPFMDIETNCKGMIAVLQFAQKHNAKVVFTSNSGIYGSPDHWLERGIYAMDETFVNNPTTPYDVNKLAAEYYCKIYHNIYGVRSCIVRFATVYGERQVVNEELNWRPLVATFIKNVLNHEEVVINDDGEQTRDLIYVKDSIQGLIKAMESSSNDADIFLLSTNTETSVNQVLESIQNITGLKANVRHTAPLAGDIRRMRYDYSKAKDILGFKPEYDLVQGVSRMIRIAQKQ